MKPETFKKRFNCPFIPDGGIMEAGGKFYPIIKNRKGEPVAKKIIFSDKQ